jgi:FkbM family methyltransferase
MGECTLDKRPELEALTDDILDNLAWPYPEEILAGLDEVVVFGTGGAADCVADILNRYRVHIVCYVDNDVKKHGSLFRQRPVISPDELIHHDQTILIASSWARDIALQLNELDKSFLDFSFCVDFERWKNHFNHKIFNVKKSVEIGKKYLNGVDLQRYMGCIRYRQTYNPLHLVGLSHSHYMNPNVLPESTDIYIDGGAWHGDTLIELKDLLGEGIEIHSFEPDEANYKILSTLIADKGFSNCHAVKKALWNQITTLNFMQSHEAVHTMQSRVSSLSSANQPFTEIEATTIDDYTALISGTPSYIKMDIEGAEPEALRGAQTLLKTNPPKLAISAYHEPNHLWELIEEIHSLNDNYKFWFSHHSQHLFESVIYARAG